MATNTIININSKTDLTVRTLTGRFDIVNSFGYMQNNNHFHVEVEGHMNSELANASIVPLFTFTNIPSVNNMTAGTFVLNGKSYPCRAKVLSDGVHQTVTGTLAAGSDIAFILDFMV
jgi:hypothetical protein